ncbi:hypothetical protein F5X99DRAFT_374488 [Biscogniauxia marginata]|nr:hypothetical protein F5X99DRAFT_374488 [Biscogniauxia marginata]
MSATTTTANPVISQLSALAIPEPGRAALLPTPPMTQSMNPALARYLTASDYDLRRDYWHDPAAYNDQPPKYYIDTVWKHHLDYHGYARSFQPLQGTERERYKGIIDKVHADEADMIKIEDNIHDRLSAAAKEIERIRRGRPSSSQPPVQPPVGNPEPPAKRKRGRPRKYPRPEDIQAESTQPAPHNRQDIHATVEPAVAAATKAELAESARIIKAGIKELDEHKKETRRPLRHARQYPEFNKWVLDTRFGKIESTLSLHGDHWFMGHRPGDPIFRIVDAPRHHPIFGLEDLAHHPVFGREDFDLTQLYFRFRYEGIVPFNYPESQQRLQEHAFPAFMTMIIAALAFNPKKPDAELPPQLGRIWTIMMQDMNDMNKSTKQELVYLMFALQRIWKIKYGTDSSKLPLFLQAQFKTSKSRLGEMAWLVCKVLSILPGYHVLRGFTEWFLQAMVGTNVQSIAGWYFNNQMGPEAQEQLDDGDLDNILFYRSDQPIEEVCGFSCSVVCCIFSIPSPFIFSRTFFPPYSTS